ncbi:hypothetical protein DNTS_008008 [Danionella cerebrum]|uniref:RNA-binding protein 14 n=1 Tax=Danionella cerebrum TaxID=2873325 RepID=A0A553NMK6_9TELE|nr:hypothetical protein DNTS_008008 [Danionella translucida]
MAVKMVKIFVGNLSQSTTPEELRSLFSQYGKVKDCDILKNFAFVHLEGKEEAEEAIRKLHKYELNGMAMNVEMSKGKTRPSTKLHVGNISTDCTNQELREKFEEYGPVVECDIVKDYAFVHMERMEDAKEAIAAMDNKAFQGKLIKVQLSTSRLRTAPGMGDQTGCYVCGEQGHWSKDCRRNQNGSHGRGMGGLPGGRGPLRGSMGFDVSGHGGLSGHGYQSGPLPPPQPISRRPEYGAYDAEVRERYLSRLPSAYPERPSMYERDRYLSVDLYEKFRAHPTASSYYDSRLQGIPPPPPPPASALSRMRLAPPSLDPYERRPLAATPSTAASYLRDRSPIRRVDVGSEGFSYERSRLSPVSRSSTAYSQPRARESYTERYGRISECDIVKNFGFVHMDNKEEADEAIQKLHHYMLNGMPMNVEMSKGKSKTSTKLHVGNISSNCTNQELRSKFEEYGPVVECDIVKDYAFVHMERVEDAMEAINGLDNSAFQGKLMNVKLSTSRLRTAPGMGERMGCYRCGQEGHWSKECPLDQNGSYREGPGSAGHGPGRFDSGGDRGGRGFHAGYSGEASYGGNYAPSYSYTRGAGYGGPAYGRGAGFESSMSYCMSVGYSVGADNSMAPVYGSEAAYGNSGIPYGSALPAYAIRQQPYGERDPYGMVDFYEKYRARPYGTSFVEDRCAVLPPVPPAPSSTVREHLSSSNLNPYERHPLPPPPTPTSSYYVRERSPIRRVPLQTEGYSYERSRLSPISALPRSAAYEVPRDPYTSRTHYTY